VQRLQSRIAMIDNEVGLDGSILGEEISDRSLEELIRLKEANSDLEKAAILNELEQSADFVSADQMRFPLLEFLSRVGKDALAGIPMGIHSTRTNGQDGVFLAFRAKERHFWYFYPRMNGLIATDPQYATREKRKIFKMIECTQQEYPEYEKLSAAAFDNSIFPILENAVINILDELRRDRVRAKIPRKLNKLISTIYTALTDQGWLDSLEKPLPDTLEKVLKILLNEELRSYEKEIRVIWNTFKAHGDRLILIDALDEFFVEQEIGRDLLDEHHQETPLESIVDEDIQLVCYQWFKPK
ncbi:MAG: hypothetical protein VKI82_14545, partial [Leptolyngbya sp.]|nr:hypothetical protein [Leptolyngbya sp.]